MRKFNIPKIPPTTTKSIRFPNDLIEKVNDKLIGTDCTFTAFVVESVRFALSSIDCYTEDTINSVDEESAEEFKF